MTSAPESCVVTLTTHPDDPVEVAACIGQYSPLDDVYRKGQRVYKRSDGEPLYLFVVGNNWYVSASYGDDWKEGRILASFGNNGFCPSHPRKLREGHSGQSWYHLRNRGMTICNVFASCDTHQY